MKLNYFITVFLLSFFIKVNAQHDIFIKQVQLPSFHIITIIDRSKPAGAKSGFSKAKAAAKMVKAFAKPRVKDSLNIGNKSAILTDSIYTEINQLNYKISKQMHPFILFQSGGSLSIIELESEMDYLVQGIRQAGLSNSILLLIPVNSLNNISVSQGGSNNTAVIVQNASNSTAVTLFRRNWFNNITIEQSMSSGPPSNSLLSQDGIIK